MHNKLVILVLWLQKERLNLKVVNISCGLGNQLAAYFNYLVIKRANPEDDIYINTLIYDIPEADKIVKQWNGYELEKVFDIKLKNIMDVLSKDEQDSIREDLRATRFWENGYRSSRAILETFNKHGFGFEVAGNFLGDEDYSINQQLKLKVNKFFSGQSRSLFIYGLKQLAWIIGSGVRRKPTAEFLKKKRDGNVLYFSSFEGIKSPDLVNEVGPELGKTLVFRPFTDDKNIEMLKIIEATNSVSIHARRSDYLPYNNDCYKYGYFKRAVKYIRRHVSDPVFVVFSEECEWCKKNRGSIGLSEKDTVYFVDWNTGADSYRDLQLMSCCKHNIITKSSFGYWAVLLNKNPNKITCSQRGDYLTTNHF